MRGDCIWILFKARKTAYSVGSDGEVPSPLFVELDGKVDHDVLSSVVVLAGVHGVGNDGSRSRQADTRCVRGC